MKRILIYTFFSIASFASILQAQAIIPSGKGSYAAFPPEAVAYDDGYFAAPYKWFEQAWPELNLHESARNRPIPTNGWWTEFLFRGLGRVQPEYHVPPITVITDGNRFGSEAWAYPQMVTAAADGFNVFYPKGFSGGGMIKGNPLAIGGTTQLQSDDANVLFADFETAAWPTGWTVANNNTNIDGPMATDEITQSPRPSGYKGERFVNTFKGDAAQITLTSPKFTIEKNYIRLYAGGGNHPDAAYVGLFINGTKVRNATGENNGNLKQHTWDVTEYKGQEAEIRIVDSTGAGWGFIMCDDIIFTDSELGGAGFTPDFRTTRANVYDWNDLGFALRSESGERHIDATITHGIPFVHFEMKDLYPIITPSSTPLVYDLNGNDINEYPAIVSAFALESEGRIYGVHVPENTILHKSNSNNFQLEIAGGKRYVVVSVLPDRSLLSTYDAYARNKPDGFHFDYEYDLAEGKIITKFKLEATNMDTGAENQDILMSFLPHHYRNTSKNFDFIAGADYAMFRGMMHTGAGREFALSYDFGGMPPYMPEPINMPEERRETLNAMLDYMSAHYTINGNTYAKGLGENSTLMLMAKSLNHPGFDLFRNNLKSEFADWLTFDESERNQKQRYFAYYPNYGGMIGFPPGYGSQGFNDLHFHNGYFVIGAARLMMVDKEFKRDYADMVKLVAKNYANWERDETSDTAMPFLRTFDPYLGHSFAGGTGDGGGNNQESSSEAINSWFGIYLLGVELNDQDIINTGAMGYMLESISTGEYWLDLYEDNFPETYGHEYVGILRTDNLAWATYFAGDPAWVLGIQSCPVDFFYTTFGIEPESMTRINNAMFKERTTFFYDGQPMHTNDDPYDNIKTMGPYLGGYHLNIMNYIDPKTAAEWVDDFCKLEGSAGTEWRNHPNTATNYYMSNAMMSYGKPAKGYHTSIPSGAVYQNEQGELTYLLYNPTANDVDVNIYKNGQVLETVKVGAGKYYNSKISGGQLPTVSITSVKDGDKIAYNKQVKVTASANDKDGRVISVEFFLNDQLVGTSYAEPFEVSFVPGELTETATLKAVATDNEGNKSEPAIVNLTPVEQTPFRGTPWNVSAETIYAVQFDHGGAEVSCHDNEIEMQGGTNYRPDTGVETEGTDNIASSNIGWTNAGEWFEYTINVQEDGVYAMSANLGSAGGGALRIFVDGVDMTGSVAVPQGVGWGRFEMFLANIPLKQGKRIMRVMIDRTGANLNAFWFVKTAEALPSEVSAGCDRVIATPANSTTLTATTTTFGTTTVTGYQCAGNDCIAQPKHNPCFGFAIGHIHL